MWRDEEPDVTARPVPLPQESDGARRDASPRESGLRVSARGVNRDDVINGAAELGVPLDEHIAFVIEAMRGVAPSIGLAGTAA